MTNTRVDHHHSSLQQSASGAPEGHLGRGGLIRRAAAGVGALSAVPQLVGTSAVAALMNEPNGAGRCVAGPAPPLPSTRGFPRRLNRMTRPHFTKPSFHLQLAGRVLVRNPRGDPRPTALGTGTPLGAPLCAGGGRRNQFVSRMIPWDSWPQPGGSHGCDGILDDCVLQVFTHPFLAAFPR